jgi:hypothetical protein
MQDAETYAKSGGTTNPLQFVLASVLLSKKKRLRQACHLEGNLFVQKPAALTKALDNDVAIDAGVAAPPHPVAPPKSPVSTI